MKDVLALPFLIGNLGQITLNALGLSSLICQMRELEMKVSKVACSSQVPYFFFFFCGIWSKSVQEERKLSPN